MSIIVEPDFVPAVGVAGAFDMVPMSYMEDAERSDTYDLYDDGFEPSFSQAYAAPPVMVEVERPEGMCSANGDSCGARATKKSREEGTLLCHVHGKLHEQGEDVGLKEVVA